MSTPTTSSSPPSIHLPSKLLLISTKAYFTPSRTLTYLNDLLSESTSIFPLPPDILFAFIPDHLTLHPCSQILDSHARTTSLSTPTTPSHHPLNWPLHLGAQDSSGFPNYGAYTGFIVPSALQSLGVTIVELGHAERRRHAGETDELIATKAKTVSDLNMIPLVCIGESSPPPAQGPLSMAIGNALKQLKPQIESVLGVVGSDKPVILAYEPVWAIGVEKPAGVEFVGAVVGGIREVVRIFERKGRSGQTKVVYGGSAGPGLWSGKATTDGEGLGTYVDGMFLGRFAHEVGGVKSVVNEVLESMRHEVKNA